MPRIPRRGRALSRADLLARLPLAPILAAQAIGVRRRARFLPEPPGPRQGTAGDGPRLRLLMIGDSSAAGVGAATQETALAGRLVADLSRDHRVEWRLLATTGATTRDTLLRLSTTPLPQCDVVVSALGVNDTTRARSARRCGACIPISPLGRLPAGCDTAPARLGEWAEERGESWQFAKVMPVFGK